MRDVQDREVVTKLFDTIAPRFASRAGGYTRLLRIGFRKGDSAEMAQVELVGSEFDPKAKTEAGAGEGAKPKSKGVGGRLRAAAERLRGKKDDKEGAQRCRPSRQKVRRANRRRRARRAGASRLSTHTLRARAGERRAPAGAFGDCGGSQPSWPARFTTTFTAAARSDTCARCRQSAAG